jgi:hypothetical protein
MAILAQFFSLTQPGAVLVYFEFKVQKQKGVTHVEA